MRNQAAQVALAEENLRSVAAPCAQVVDLWEREVDEILRRAQGRDEDTWREIARTDGRIRQIFVRRADGQLAFPSGRATDTSEREQSFLQRTAAVWQSGAQFAQNAQEESTVAASQWHLWYWNNGRHFLRWQNTLDGGIIGAEIEPMRFLADLLAVLPDSSSQTSSQFRTELRDSGDRVLYLWGNAEVQSANLIGEMRLSGPLAGWRLLSFGQERATQRSAAARINRMWIFAAAVFAVILLTHLFFQNHRRELREASQRVNFVNQVSHELRTPLTNIRLYAELLQNEWQESDAAPGPMAQNIAVIVRESERLSRLIGNVLTFSRTHQEKQKISFRSGVIDDIVRQSLQPFLPSFERLKIAVETDLMASAPCQFDPDALEQILTNLLSNVEKYAADGRWVRVATRQVGEHCEIEVCDRGPGIPTARRELVFQPFERLSDKLSAAAGTGIGLTIARSLARLHGGDVTCEPSETGARFLAKIRTKPL